MSRRTMQPAAVAAVLCALAAAGAPAANPPPHTARPDFTGTLRPLEGNAQEVQGGMARLWKAPNPDLLDPASRRERQAQALFSPDVAPGIDLGPAPNGGRDEPRLDALAPNLNTRFEGLDILTHTEVGLAFPPDTIVAASPTKVLEATNSALRLSGRTGANPQILDLNGFFDEPLRLQVFDPKVYFDRLSGRFFLVALGYDDVPQQSFLFVGVSRGDSPAGFGDADWCKYQINSRREGSFADYPGLGVNENWLAVSVNNFRYSGDFNSAFIYAIPKQPLVGNSQACPFPGYVGFRPANDAEGVISFTIQPAQHYTANNLPGSPLFFVSSQPLLQSSSYTLWRLTGNGRESAELSWGALRASVYGDPPEAPQGRGGAPFDTGGSRVTQAAFRDGRLWAVHATSCALGAAPNESCVRALEITPSAGGGSITFEQTYGVEGWYAWWPGVAINGPGDVTVAFQRSRGDRFLDISYNGRRFGSPSFDTIRTLKLGQCALFEVDDLDRTRSGDYVGAQADPADDRSFWIAGEYAGTMPILGCGWKTAIARVSYPPVAPVSPVLFPGGPLSGGTPGGGGEPGGVTDGGSSSPLDPWPRPGERLWGRHLPPREPREPPRQ